MWLCKPITLPRRAVLAGGLVGGLALAACGFTPVYGPDGAGTRLFGQVRVMDPKTSDDYAFNRRITERLGPDQAARFALEYRLAVATVAQAITPDEVTTRYALNGTADYTLTEGGRAVARGQVSSFASYSTTGTTIATLAAEQDARERLMRMLADQVLTRLLAAAP